MMRSQKDSEQNLALPSFPIRWFMYFRRNPYRLINFKLLYLLMFKRSPTFWDNFMIIENSYYLKKQGEVATEKPKTIRPKGLWRDEELPPVSSSKSD